MFKIELENRDFPKSLYFYIVAEKRAASGRLHYTVDAGKLGCGRLSAPGGI